MDNFNNSNGYTNQNNSYPNISNSFSRSNQFEQNIQTNKWQVQNLQDALNRYAPPNSRGVYHYKDGDTEYECEIYTDMNGNKSYQVYKRILCTNDINPINMVKYVEEMLQRINKLEEKINAKSTTVTNDGSTEVQP